MQRKQAADFGFNIGGREGSPIGEPFRDRSFTLAAVLPDQSAEEVFAGTTMRTPVGRGDVFGLRRRLAQDIHPRSTYAPIAHTNVQQSAPVICIARAVTRETYCIQRR